MNCRKQDVARVPVALELHKLYLDPPEESARYAYKFECGVCGLASFSLETLDDAHRLASGIE